MNDRRPSDFGDPIAEALLEAARDYQPPRRLRRRVLEALGLPLTLAIGASASTAVASVTVGKVFLLAVAAIGLGGGGLFAYRAVTANSSSSPARAAPGAPRRPREAPPPARPAAAPEEPPGAAPTTGLAVGPAAAAHRRMAAPAAAARNVGPAVAPPTSRPLAEEIELLNRAQAAARRRDHRETLARIGEHDRRFPAGALAQEAEVLRISALFGMGERADAAARARRFLDRNGDGVLAARVSSMLASQASD